MGRSSWKHYDSYKKWSRILCNSGLKFGNIFIAPEPQRGWEAKSDLLYHSSAVAPTHQYLAAYYYMQKRIFLSYGFIGRHATHEWLPWKKKFLLSTTDYQL